MAGEEVVGKTDAELTWSDNAEALRAADAEVLRSGEPSFIHEFVDQSAHGQATLNVCKFVGEFEGQQCVMGVSFVVE